VQAGLWPNPVVGYTGEEFSTRAFSEKSEHFAFIEQTILLGGKLGKSRRIFAQEKVLAEQEAIAQRHRILNNVRMLFYEALGAQRRDVTAEIWRNFDRLDRYRREQMAQGGMRTAPMRDHSSMAAMAANAPSEYLALREIGAERGPLTPPAPAVEGNQMTDMMRRMDVCLMRLSAHLIELERETGAACSSPKWILEHTNAILLLIDEMSTTRNGSHAAR
jgi:hypothetical protein